MALRRRSRGRPRHRRLGVSTWRTPAWAARHRRRKGVTAFVMFETAPVPTALMACTRNRYVVPFVSPVTTCVVAVERTTRRLGEVPDVRRHQIPRDGARPSKAGAVHDTVAWPFPTVAGRERRRPAPSAGGVAWSETVEYPLVRGRHGLHRNRYFVPFVRPVTTWVVVSAEGLRRQGTTRRTASPHTGDGRTAIGAGAVDDTVACPFPAVADPIVGGPGATRPSVDQHGHGGDVRVPPVTMSTRVVIDVGERQLRRPGVRRRDRVGASRVPSPSPRKTPTASSSDAATTSRLPSLLRSPRARVSGVRKVQVDQIRRRFDHRAIGGHPSTAMYPPVAVQQ